MRELDQWAEWLVRTRFGGLSEQEIAEELAVLECTRDLVLAVRKSQVVGFLIAGGLDD